MSASDRLRTPFLSLALLLAAALVALGAAGFLRKVETFQPLGFAVSPRAGAWEVVQQGDAAAVELGDRIVLVNGERAAGEVALRSALRAQPQSELLVQRGETLLTLPYLRPAVDLDLPYLVLALIGGLYLLVGGYTLLRDRRGEALVFNLWCLTSAALYLLSPTSSFDPLGRTLFAVEELARILLPALTLHLFLVFPTRLAWIERHRRLLPFIYLPSAVLLVLQLDLALANGRFLSGSPERAGMVALLESLDRASLYLLVFGGLLAVALLVQRLRANPRWDENRQLLWVVLGMAGGYVPFVAFYVAPYALGWRLPELFTTLAVMPLGFVPLAFAYAILRYKLWDIGVIVRDALSTTMTLLLGVFGFSLAHFVISRGIPQDLAMARSLGLFAAGLLIAGLLVPTRRSLGQVLERLQYGGTFAKRQALARFGREVLHERQLDRLAERLLEHLSSALDLDRANLYLHQGTVMRRARVELALPAELPLGCLGEQIWAGEVIELEAITLPGADGAVAPDNEPGPVDQLLAAGYRYVFPLEIRGVRVGVAVTGYKDGQIPLSTDDVELVRGLLNQSALAIENAQLLGELESRLAEVSALQRHNQGIIESTPAGIAVLDGEQRITSANEAFAALVGQPVRELYGQPLSAWLPVTPPPPGELLEVSWCDPKGQERFLQLSTAVFVGSAERILVALDVSERVAMENTLKEKERLASLGMLAAGVAHEVNTPITGISSYAQMLLADTPADDPRRKLLEKVEKQTFRAARIVSNLLEFARDKPHQQAPMSLLPVVREAVQLLEERIMDSGVELVWQLPADPVEIVGNEGELHQVLTNLLVNALDAMPGGGRLEIAVIPGAQQVRVVVSDTGTGIAVDQLERIFQPFFSTKLNRGGTGLGLSISYNIVRRHGGTLHATSSPGQGSRFEFELPRSGAVAKSGDHRAAS